MCITISINLSKFKICLNLEQKCVSVNDACLHLERLVLRLPGWFVEVDSLPGVVVDSLACHKCRLDLNPYALRECGCQSITDLAGFLQLLYFPHASKIRLLPSPLKFVL